MANDTPSWLITYCNSSFWDQSLIYDPTPQFSRCFQEVALVWGPCFFFWLIAIPQIFVVFQSTEKALPISTLHISKLFTTICIFIVTIVEVGYFAANNTGQDLLPADVATPAIFAVTMVLVLFLQVLFRVKGHVTSGLLFLFWFALVICQCITLVSLDQKAADGYIEDMLSFVTFHIFYFFALVALVLSSFAEFKPDKKEKTCPEVTSSFLSQILFWWFNPIVWLGYKKALVYEDLWELNERDKTKIAAPKLVGHWDKEMEKSRRSRNSHGPSAESTVYANVGLDDVVIETKGKNYDFKEKYYKPSLVKAMVKTYGRTMFVAAIFKLANDTIQFVSPQLMSLLIQFTEDSSISQWVGYVYAVGMYVVAVVQAILLNQYFHRCMLVGMNIRTGVISMIYKKSLQISNESRKESTVGEIVNLMSTDAQRFMDLTSYIHILWSGPYTIALALYLLWQELGPSVMAGFAVMVLLIPINGVISTYMRKMTVNNMKLKDKRIKLMNEILNGVKVLKLYAWEVSFEEQASKIRDEELKLGRKIAYLRAVMMFLWTVAPFMVAFVTFAVYVFSDENNILNSEKAFVSISLFNILRFPLIMLPAMISAVVQAQVSVKRLTKFLTNREIDTQAVDRSPKSDDDAAVEIRDGTFAWESDHESDLRNINMSVKNGSLVAVVGHVGSGKSSLISAILGDMEKKDGYVGVHGSVAYVPQTAWIQNATLKDNILFGKTLETDSKKEGKGKTGFTHVPNGVTAVHDGLGVSHARYLSIIKATALGPDLAILPGGDQTEIGEKGINLSGGQKQRVSLARAICSDADVYLLDDPLSAVDSHIGKHIFENVISKAGVLQDKTRILVTHGIQYLPQVDCIFVMDQGVISERGTYQELLQNGEKFSKFLEEYATNDDSESEAEENEVLSDEDISLLIDPNLNMNDVSSLSGDQVQPHSANGLIRRNSSRKSIRSNGKIRHKSVTSNGGRSRYKSSSSKGSSIRKRNIEETNKEGKEKEGTKLTTVETMEEGKVKFGVYREYMNSIGLKYCVLVILACTLYQASYVGASVWLSIWTNENDKLLANETSENTGMRLGVYGAFGVFQAIFVLGNGLIQAIATIAAAKTLHYDMLKNIFRVPAQFFDTTPLGRIVNRFAKDTYTIDEMLPQTIRMWLSCFFSVVSTLIVIIAATPIFAAVIIPVGILYFFGQRYYVATSRQLKRLESVTRSPIYSHFGETVSGVSVIRAFGQNERFIAQSEARVDKNQECYYPNIVSNRWLSVRLEVVGNAIVFFAALSAVLSRDSIGGALAGLSLSYALTITSTLNWWVRQMSELETNVVAVERVREYAQVEREADWEIPDKKPDSKWPETGVVRFRNYSTRYRDNLDLVLKDIDCIFKSGEKVGIVGRTGAGKSSLTLALFRLIEASGGQIEIDGVNISRIGLHDLRKKLTIIPQDPVLFSGTMRLNIDPFKYYSDEQIWNSLEHAHLKDYVSGLPDKLEHICAEGGENLSVGQRQLVCLARALLRKSKVLVLDEATAAVDMQTDDLIQQTIRNEFSGCTVVTIAHRLNTIMDYDKIVVLDTGKVVEFASPSTLLEKKGIFYGMAKDAGLT